MSASWVRLCEQTTTTSPIAIFDYLRLPQNITFHSEAAVLSMPPPNTAPREAGNLLIVHLDAHPP
jgi:hypothetical protein